MTRKKNDRRGTQRFAAPGGVAFTWMGKTGRDDVVHATSLHN